MMGNKYNIAPPQFQVEDWLRLSELCNDSLSGFLTADKSTFENLKQSLLLIGDGQIRFDDYQQSFTYTQPIGSYTLSVTGSRKMRNSGLGFHAFVYHTMLYKTDSVKVSTFYFADTVTFSFPQQVAFQYEYMLTNKIETIAQVIHKILLHIFR